MLDQMTFNEVVLDAAREVFETMIFMDVETDGQEHPPVEGTCLLGSITFKGTLEGCLAVCVAKSTAEKIARNMLALEPDQPISLNETCDAIGEVANMVMGSIKTRIQDTYPSIEVSIPSVITGRELRNTLGDKAERVSVNATLDQQDGIEFTLLYRQTKG